MRRLSTDSGSSSLISLKKLFSFEFIGQVDDDELSDYPDALLAAFMSEDEKKGEKEKGDKDEDEELGEYPDSILRALGY